VSKCAVLRVLPLLVSILLLEWMMAPTALAGTSTTAVIGRPGFPVTGFQIAMAVIVAVVLIAGGIALRRWSRSQRP
jgi:hypothetical protein